MDTLAPADLYEHDFYAWTQDQAARVRALGARNDGLDVENVAEEIESLGKSQRSAVRNLLFQLITHLLKLRFHPDQRSRKHWRGEVMNFRQQLRREFKDSPSLRARRHEIATEAWEDVADDFPRRLEADDFDPNPAILALSGAERRPFDLDTEVLNQDWFPDAPT